MDLNDDYDIADVVPMQGQTPSLDFYWQISLVGHDWQRVFGLYMAKESDKAAFKDGEAVLGMLGGKPTYWLKKDRFPAEELAKVFGLTADALEKGRYLTAYPIKGMNEDKLATVPYFGRA